MEHYIPRLLIAGAHEGCGKSLLATGITMAFRKRKAGVSCCIHGTAMGQSVLYQRMSGRYARSLDSRLLTANQIALALLRASAGAEIVLIDGRRGLYSGTSKDPKIKGSDAHLAGLLGAPVVLVVDAKRFDQNIGALIYGYQSFSEGFHLTGSLANRVDVDGGPKDRAYYSKLTELYGVAPLLGSVSDLPYQVEIPSREVSQIHRPEALPHQFFVDLVGIVEQCVDLDSLMKIAKDAPPIEFSENIEEPSRRKCRIAVSDDICFNPCYQDNIELLKFYGAEVVPFSPLADEKLPKKIGGMYLTGAYLADYAGELSANRNMFAAIRAFSEMGGVIYSEGSGTAYLCDSFVSHLDKLSYQGIGLIPGTAIPQTPQKAYLEAVTTEESILGRQGLIMKGLSTREWRLDTERPLLPAMKVSYEREPAQDEGFLPFAQHFNTFAFMHLGSNSNIAKNIVEASEVVQGLGD